MGNYTTNPLRLSGDAVTAELLDRFLKWLSGRLRPKLVRGDVGFGNEAVIRCCETNRTHYLFKVKRSKLSKRSTTRWDELMTVR